MPPCIRPCFLQCSTSESENNNFGQTISSGPRPLNNNDDTENRLHPSPHRQHQSHVQNSQYSSSSSGHHPHHPPHHHPPTSRLSSKSTNDLKTHQFSSTSSSALLGVDENHPQGSWVASLGPDDPPPHQDPPPPRTGRRDEERDSPDYDSPSRRDSPFEDSSSSSGCRNNESGSPSPRLISKSSLASSRQSSSSQLQHQQQRENKNRVRSVGMSTFAWELFKASAKKNLE